MDYIQYKSDRYAYIFQVLFYSIMLYLGINYTKFYFSMDKEFGIIEFAGAFGLFITSLVLFVAAKNYKYLNPGFKDYRFFLLSFASVAFFWAAGEEISWGQHMFKTVTPDWLAEINGQKETNLHNINKKFFDRTLERLIAILTMITAIQHFRKKEMFLGFRLPTFFLNLALFTIMLYRKNDGIHWEVWSVSYFVFLLYPIRAILDKDQRSLVVILFTMILMCTWVYFLVGNMDTLYRSPNFYHEIRETSFSILTVFFAYQILQDVKNHYIGKQI